MSLNLTRDNSVSSCRHLGVPPKRLIELQHPGQWRKKACKSYVCVKGPRLALKRVIVENYLHLLRSLSVYSATILRKHVDFLHNKKTTKILTTHFKRFGQQGSPSHVFCLNTTRQKKHRQEQKTDRRQQKVLNSSHHVQINNKTKSAGVHVVPNHQTHLSSHSRESSAPGPCRLAVDCRHLIGQQICQSTDSVTELFDRNWCNNSTATNQNWNRWTLMLLITCGSYLI